MSESGSGKIIARVALIYVVAVSALTMLVMFGLLALARWLL